MHPDLIISTTDPETALNYLQKSLIMEIDEEKAKPILDLVMAGKIRIGDPEVCNGAAIIYPLENCSEEDRDIVKKWYANL